MYNKSITRFYDKNGKPESITLSNGPDSAEQYAWIEDNYEVFFSESLHSYLKIIRRVTEQCNYSFLYVFLTRYSEEYKGLQVFSVDNQQVLCVKTAVDELTKQFNLSDVKYVAFMKEGENIAEYIPRKIRTADSLFECLRKQLDMVICFRNLYSEGNGLDFYSESPGLLQIVKSSAKIEGFIDE